MKLSCMQENLSKALGIVSRAVATRTTLPITNNVLLATEDGRLKLAATNLEIAITHWIGAKIEDEGAITVPARLLNEFVNSLPNDKVEIEFLPKLRSLELKCARFEARISGMDAEDFPPIPEIDQGISVQIDANALRQSINRVAFAAATEDSRPVLTGVNTEIEESTLTMAAADGFRLSVDKMALSAAVEEKVTVIIPARALQEVNRLIGEGQEPVVLTVNPAKSQVLFKMDNIRLTSQLIQGSFPQLLTAHSYRALNPGPSWMWRTSCALRGRRRSSPGTPVASCVCRSAVAPTVTERESCPSRPGRRRVGDDFGEIDAQVHGEDAKVAFNARYLTDLLAVIGKGDITLEMNDPSKPGLFRPVGEDNFLHVVMPMYVQW